MNITNEDLIKLTKFTAQQIEQVTCAVCCKYYIAPETATCGHTLCHTCWCGRLNCVYCAKPVERRSLRHNHVIQDITEKVHALNDVFEKLFNVNVPEILMEVETDDSTKNVREWLASSQNHFSAPVESSEQSSREMAQPLNVSSSKIDIHKTSEAKSFEQNVKTSKIPQDQVDWDKIEAMPDTEDIRKDGQNVVGPMDIEPFYIDDDAEYSITNPRRSSRKRDAKPNENNKIDEKHLQHDQNPNDTSEEIDRKSNKAKQNWLNVKRMRKEFSKLNKKNRSKLNVSIQMCKKSKNTINTLDSLPKAGDVHYDIDENTPIIFYDKDIAEKSVNKENKNTKNFLPHSNTNTNANDKNKTVLTSNSKEELVNDQTNLKAKTDNPNKPIEVHKNPINTVISPFYKRSFLHPKCLEEKCKDTAIAVQQTHYNVVVDSNTNNVSKTNDDIEITIKVANTVANIIIKRKDDIQLKINTDREIQTSLDPQDTNKRNNEKLNSFETNQAQNIVINVGDSHKVQLNHQTVTNPRVKELKKDSVSGKTGPEKKNTDSADTGTAQYEITESVEKELSKVMELEHTEDKQVQSKITKNKGEFPREKKFSKDIRSQKSTTHPCNLEYLNDLDIFDSEPIKESDVQILKNTEHTVSEILLSTVKTKNKTQKVIEKRKNTSDEDLLPEPKKVKMDDDICKSKEIQPESDSMNYDEIMGTVFANIDAEIEATQKTQNKNNHIENEENKIEADNCIAVHDKCTPEFDLPKNIITTQPSQIISNLCGNQKDSENVFSIEAIKENENDKAPLASVNKMMPLHVPSSNVDDFLTPVVSQRTDIDVQIINDDSDMSVVEETPQKSSFTKVKQKSNDAKKDDDQSQKLDLSAKLSLKNNSSANKNSIINLSDTSASKNDVTTIKLIDRKPTETPLTISKFVDQIQHNSTPLAKKSLNFDSETVDDITLCPTSDVAKTTQEREFMIKAFEKTPTAPAVKAQGLRSLALKHKKYVVAGSCLTPAENANLKKLCALNKWSYIDKYTKGLTHLVVSVDQENKAQRTVKYMCALAASIWIVSYEWVQKSLQSNDPITEEQYEVLDNTGHPGPMRSRIATKKLFHGISFFCLEPFSILEIVTFKSIIESAGGRVVSSAAEVRVTDKTTTPAILLAEPENTQEDRFVYMAMELCIVPVNYEWVLNCLGSYRLTSILELLLCPVSILPKAIHKWPPELLARDEDDE